MVIDDEASFLELVKINLEHTGKYEVQTLLDARDALSRIRTFKPDVILLDILMPKTDGVEVCRSLNADPDANRIPIITLSALDTDKDKLMMYKLGVVDFLVKPIESNDLLAGIEKALQNKGLS
jgi:two-component system alkaline phosphatase synthesis response regulator PhoP